MGFRSQDLMFRARVRGLGLDLGYGASASIEFRSRVELSQYHL